MIEIRSSHEVRYDKPELLASREQVDHAWLSNEKARVSPELIARFLAAGANKSEVITASLSRLLGQAQSGDGGWSMWQLAGNNKTRYESPVFQVHQLDQHIPVSQRTPARSARLQIIPVLAYVHGASASLEVLANEADSDPNAVYAGPVFHWRPDAVAPLPASVSIRMGEESGSLVELGEHRQHWPIYAGGIKAILSAEAQLISVQEAAVA